MQPVGEGKLPISESRLQELQVFNFFSALEDTSCQHSIGLNAGRESFWTVEDVSDGSHCQGASNNVMQANIGLSDNNVKVDASNFKKDSENSRTFRPFRSIACQKKAHHSRE